ncbi:MAG: hypothetical protein QXY45_03975 [Candidatus Aenigmatarchaeota archaeon]
MAKRQEKKKEKLKSDKKVVTIRIPPLNLKSQKFWIMVLGILLAVSLFFNFRGGFGKGKMSLSGLVYMCPPSNCDTTNIEKWSSELGYSVTPYEASWARVPIGLIFEGKSVEIVDVSTESGFYGSVCEALGNKKACDISEEAKRKESEQACERLKKVDKPQLEAFVVSYCPYGLQMQRVLVPVHELLGKVADIKIRYIGSIENGKVTAMHGDQEAQENLKQICIREEQSDKYWNYISCFMKAQGRSEICSDEVKLDKKKLEDCIKDPNKGLKYAKVDFDLANKYSVTGSPTLILNGERVSEYNFGGRSAEAVKTLICCSMKTKTSECDTKLSSEQANIAFAETYSSGQGSTGSGAQC